MIKEITRNFPDLVKTRVQVARKTLLGLEKDLKKRYEKVSRQTLNRQELGKRVTEFQKKAADTMGKAINANLEKAYGALNLPTRAELDEISRKVNKINQEIRKLAETRGKHNGNGRRPAVPSRKAARKTMSRKTARA
jgi:polyhydroxyalkanoate synthesis regulator phasin